MNYLWNKVNSKYISKVTFYITDDENREVGLNDTDISMTVVIFNCEKRVQKLCKVICKKMEEQRIRNPDTEEISYTSIHSNIEVTGFFAIVTKTALKIGTKLPVKQHQN